MKFHSLLEKPSNKILLMSFILSFIMTWVFVIFIFAPLLAQFPAGAGLMDMKAAWTKKNMDKIINIWKRESLTHYIELMTFVNNIDFIFMVVYGWAVFSGLLLVARQLKDSEKLQKVYLNLSIVSWVSVLFDVIEGIFIAIILFDPSNITETSAIGVSLSATLCIIVLYSCVFLWIVGLIIVLVKHLKK